MEAHHTQTPAVTRNTFDSRQLKQILAKGEKSEQIFYLLNSALIFTDKRLLIVSAPKVEGKWTPTHSLPYSSITHYSTLTAPEPAKSYVLSLWTGSSTTPVQLELQSADDNTDLHKALTEYVISRRSSRERKTVVVKSSQAMGMLPIIGLVGAAAFIAARKRCKKGKCANANFSGLSPQAAATLIKAALKK